MEKLILERKKEEKNQIYDEINVGKCSEFKGDKLAN